MSGEVRGLEPEHRYLPQRGAEKLPESDERDNDYHSND
jgi:hypothetical protein